MGPVVLRRDIDAPRERIFDLIADLSLRPSYVDHFASEFRLERLDAIGLGAAARMKVDAPGGLKRMETVIAEVDRPHLLVERGRGGRWNRIPVNTVWELREGAAGTTELTLSVWSEPPDPISVIRDLGAGRWWRRRWSKGLDRLTRMLEADETPAGAVRVGGSDRLPVA